MQDDRISGREKDSNRVRAILIIFGDTKQWIHNPWECGLGNLKYFFLRIKTSFSNSLAFPRNALPLFIRTQMREPERIGTALYGACRVNFTLTVIEKTPSIRMFLNAVAILKRVHVFFFQVLLWNLKEFCNGCYLWFVNIYCSRAAGVAGPALLAFELNPFIKKIRTVV